MASHNFFNVLVPQGFFFTPEGGFAVRFINKTGASSIKGYLVTANSAVDNTVILAQIDGPDIIGVFYESGIPDGSYAYVVMNGKADVYFNSVGAVRGNLARNREGVDVGSNGMALSETLPTAPFSTNKHFQEIGHCLETRVGEGLALVNLHFN
jgi:hypothetical protein